MDRYELANGGFVRFSREDIQAYGPKYENCWVTLKNGVTYLLSGRTPMEQFERWGL